MENVLKAMASRAERLCVASLPASVRASRQRNMELMKLCSDDLTAEQVSEIVDLINGDWSMAITCEGKLTHVCVPGCCRDDKHYRQRLHEALRAMLGKMFSTPLLYSALTAFQLAL